MIGFRGASRYYDERYREGFLLECRAMRARPRGHGPDQRQADGPLLPHRRRRAAACWRVMAEHGLRRGEDGLEVYVMCEIPSNVILAEEFAEIFDGFSIGSNDLTQLTLGLDRDSEIVAHSVRRAQPGRDAAGRRRDPHAPARAAARSGICGQAPSDYPEFAAFLVQQRHRQHLAEPGRHRAGNADDRGGGAGVVE